MAHRFLIKEIALQAGVGIATVDRVLNGRANVREGTRRRIEQAIKELEKQELQLATSGRKLVIDVLVEAPDRFASEIQEALESELPSFHPAIFRPRFHLRETMTTAEVVDALQSIAKRGSHGVFLKARDVPEISHAIGALQREHIPVVTTFTDVPLSGRIAYAGLDNRVAGATAAYLIGQWLRRSPSTVLITMSDERFRGEEEREISFRRAIRMHYPNLDLLDASGGHGLDIPTEAKIEEALSRNAKIAAVYSMGGGNMAILRALEAANQVICCFIGHDLDRDNVHLLRKRKIHAVIYHDLRQDMRSACQHVLHFHKLLPPAAISQPSSVVVVTPENLPEHIASRMR
ncbi:MULTISPECIES: LacI family DNA-binding transcriptional regulator [unclassified Caballeronia]|uniref:LacI family DNA-binding transcriptional regulator n=1 Tax=unclassified Caballeronia TaxID=2646786 RepID=UPI00025BAD4D|nr:MULTISPECIES: LacI family DNA-binding transcriptional regulator [unclassified Caballeronia]EKS70360.1 transcriptional regulator protein, laci-family [Burkholderia sp. SJ98]MCE4546366.1 LacI family DNA-binding transcriptional regulator [Caballeronia sp. PC1]MCE4573159.1 LacI family DNA-binding transcriptional regulator [Caballeronia sp. CLC5]